MLEQNIVRAGACGGGLLCLMVDRKQRKKNRKGGQRKTDTTLQKVRLGVDIREVSVFVIILAEFFSIYASPWSPPFFSVLAFAMSPTPRTSQVLQCGVGQNDHAIC